MNRTFATADLATLPPSRVGRSSPHFGAINEILLKVVSGLSVKNLANVLGATLKTARNRVEAERKFTIDDLAAMLHSEHGWEVVAAIMAEAPQPPRWWRMCASVMGAADARKMQIAAKRKMNKALEDALDADRDITDAIERAEAFAVHDEEFTRAVHHASRERTGVPHRAVVAPAKARAKIGYAGRER
jgi:predicted transcriptional regulator